MTHEELRGAIRRMSLMKIMGFASQDVWKLTDGFKEDLVKDIVLKGKTDIEQLNTIDSLKKKHDLARRFYSYGPAPYPEYFMEWVTRIKFGLVIDSSNKDDNVLAEKGSFYINTGNTVDDPDEKERLNDRIKELEAENASLRKQLEEKKLKNQGIEVQGAGNDEWIVELLAHLCYGDEQIARDILDEIRGKEDPVIADIIFERKQKNQISPKTQNRELWKILHAAKLYRGIEGNFNTALRRRQQR